MKKQSGWFLISGLVLCFLLAEAIPVRSENFSTGRTSNQRVYLNIPAYRLDLYREEGNNFWRILTIPVGVGRGTELSDQTPIGEGYLYAKATGVVFRYGDQNPENLIGKVIEYSYTFDRRTLRPVKIPMPKDMKSVFMSILNEETQRVEDRFVLHQTTDWFTVETPSSNGCLRIKEEDMQMFYDDLAPETRSGRFPVAVPIYIYYDVVEYDSSQEQLILHANIYHKPINYFDEVVETLREQSIDPGRIHIPRLKWHIATAEAQFRLTERYVRRKLKQPPHKRLVLDEEKEQLHYPIFLGEILR